MRTLMCSQTTSAILFKHLCQLVDHPPFDVVQDDHLMAVVKQVIVDGLYTKINTLVVFIFVVFLFLYFMGQCQC